MEGHWRHLWICKKYLQVIEFITSLTPKTTRVSGGISMSSSQQVSISLLRRVEVTGKLCMSSNCCRLLCRIVSPSQTVSSTSSGKSPQTSETELELQDCLQMPVIQNNDVIDKNEDGSDITQDVDVLVWWRVVGQSRFPRIPFMTRQFLSIPTTSVTSERV